MITFPEIWRCAGDILKVKYFFVGTKTHYPSNGNVQVISPKFIMAATSPLYNWAQKANLWGGDIGLQASSFK